MEEEKDEVRSARYKQYSVESLSLHSFVTSLYHPLNLTIESRIRIPWKSRLSGIGITVSVPITSHWIAYC